MAQEIQAVADREGNVQEHDLHVAGGGQLPALGQGGGGQHLVLVRQHQFERTVGARVVVDQQQSDHRLPRYLPDNLLDNALREQYCPNDAIFVLNNN